MIRIIVADDHEIYRKGFHASLRRHRGLDVVAEAENGHQLLEKVSELRPDIVVTNTHLPLLDGLEATRLLSTAQPAPPVIAVSSYTDDELIFDMLEAGARGYLQKSASTSELIRAVHAVYNGETYLCEEVSLRLARLIGPQKPLPAPVRLNETETEIVRLICEQHSSKQIAALVGLNTRTVENYRKKLQEKIGARNMIGIALYGIREGIYKV